MLYLCHDVSAPVEYCTSGKFVCDRVGAVHPRSTLNSYVLLLGCEGEYAIEQDGVEYMLTPGTYVLLSAGHTHGGTKPCPPKLSHFWCHFYMRSGTYITDAPSIKSAETKNSGYAPLDIPPNTCENEELILPEFGTTTRLLKNTDCYSILSFDSTSGNRFRREICNNIITEILLELSDTFLSSNAPSAKQSSLALTENVTEYIRINAASIRSDVADYLDIIPSI